MGIEKTMPLVTWSDDYSVSIKEIDDQHKKLFDLLNELHDAMKKAKGKSILGKVIKDLISYTEFHFSTEEILLQNCKYPEFEEHKLKHDEFTKKVKEFEQKYLDGSVLAFSRNSTISYKLACKSYKRIG